MSRHALILFVGCLVFVLQTVETKAVDRDWNQVSGIQVYNTGTNWTPNGTPGAGDNVFFGPGLVGMDVDIFLGAASAANNVNVTDGTVEFLDVGGSNLNNAGVVTIDDAAATGLVDGAFAILDSATWTSSGDAFVGSTGTGYGTLTVENGGDFISPSIYIGDAAGAVGEVNVDGAGSTLTANAVGHAFGIYVGDEGTGTLNVTGGGLAQTTDAAGAADVSLGFAATGEGTLNITGLGSKLIVEDFLIGENGTGHLNVSAGGWVDTLGSSPDAFIGFLENSNGDATITGDNSQWDMQHLFVGNAGTGSLDIEAGGEVDATANVTIGEFATGSGTATVTGSGSSDSLLEVGSILTVGNAGEGTLDVLAGADVTVGSDLKIGNDAASLFDNTVTVDGAGSTIAVTGFLDVGFAGRGILNVTDGAVVTATSELRIAPTDGSTGQATVDGLGSSITSSSTWSYAGNEGTATLDITNGGFVQTVNFVIADSDVDADLNSSQVTVNGSSGGTASRLNVTGGTFFIGGSSNEDGGIGFLDIEAGGLVTSNGGIVGSGENIGPNGTGTVTVTGEDSYWDATANGFNPILLGDAGNGTLHVLAGGRVDATTMNIGDDTGTETAVMNIDGDDGNGTSSTVNIDQAIYVGDSRAASINITNGGILNTAIDFTSDFSIGTNATADGVSVTVSGAGSQLNHLNEGRLSVGDDGGNLVNPSLLTVNTGGQVSTHDFFVADSEGSYGIATVNGANSEINISGNASIGDQSNGILNIENGGLFTSVDHVRIGGAHEGAGAVNLSGAGSQMMVGTYLSVGDSNAGAGLTTGDFLITDGGSANTGGHVFIGRNGSGVVGALDVGGAGAATSLTVGDSVYIGGNDAGNGGAGILRVKAGSTVSVTNELKLWTGGLLVLDGGLLELETLDATDGSVTFTSGTLRYKNSALLDNAALGDIFDGAVPPTLEANQHLEVGGNTTLDSTLRMNDATASFSVGTTTDLSNLDWDAGTLNITGQAFSVGGSGLLGDSVIVNQNQVLGVPNHQLTIDSGADLYVARGGLNVASAVNNELLVVSKTTNVDFDADDAGAGLTNNGNLVLIDATVDGDIVNNGSIEMVGSVTLLSDAALAAAGSIDFDLGGTAVGEFDALAIDGNAMLDGALSVTLDGGFLPSIGDTFEIMDIDGTQSGVFAGLAQGALVGMYGSVGLYIDYAAGDGNDVSLVATYPGDFQLDVDVDGLDFLKWQRGETPNLYGDYADWEANFGATAPAVGAGVAATAAVPEPASWLLGMMGVMVVGACRWRAGDA